MSTTLELVLLLAGGVAVGYAVGWFSARLNAKHEVALAVAQTEARLKQAMAELSEQNARLDAWLASERATHADKLKIYQDAEDRLQQAFKALSSDALNTSSERFLTVAARKLEDMQGQSRLDLDARRQGIDDLLRPMKDSLTQVAATLGQVENARREDYGHLAQRLESLDRETTTLGRALRTPHGRGRWGEVQLRRVVEMAGMIERCDFDEQVSTRHDSGLLRPDLIIHLPGGKTVVVDAKAPLSAYLEASDAADDATREARLKQHATQVRTHIDQLSAKAYWQQFPHVPEFVVMFLPGEAFFGAALQVDPLLIEFGAERNVIAASPLTLLALLRTVAHGWKQEALAENAREISAMGRDLYDRMCTMAEHLLDLRKRLEGAVQSYNETIGSLEGRVFPTARRLRELGVSATRDLKVLEPVEQVPRRLQAADLVGGDPDNRAVDAELISDEVTGRVPRD